MSIVGSFLGAVKRCHFNKAASSLFSGNRLLESGKRVSLISSFSSLRLGGSNVKDISKIRSSSILSQARGFQTLQPRSRKYKKAQKGRVPVRTGGSTKGNYIAFGQYGLRIKEGCRLRAKILTSIYASVRRKIKSAKDSKIYLRVFPDIPVSSKGSEARMGKGKGTFDYYAARVPKDKILFELGGPNLGVELAKEAFRLASHKLPVGTEFVVLSEKTKQPLVFPPTTVPFLQAK
ncbi:54S ribosomal protein L16, mitochondrial [Smittium culicis]|uniref:54S ribosomal protein L16, mitochondrial n=1 Tax=Smittium culicis TaxID=133412 RepID=A0A1R1XLI1_9FUNG|nr:54S ribosomal protein L16, mitochondrial [Smittium culicis]